MAKTNFSIEEIRKRSKQALDVLFQKFPDNIKSGESLNNLSTDELLALKNKISNGHKLASDTIQNFDSISIDVEEATKLFENLAILEYMDGWVDVLKIPIKGAVGTAAEIGEFLYGKTTLSKLTTDIISDDQVDMAEDVAQNGIFKYGGAFAKSIEASKKITKALKDYDNADEKVEILKQFRIDYAKKAMEKAAVLKYEEHLVNTKLEERGISSVNSGNLINLAQEILKNSQELQDNVSF